MQRSKSESNPQPDFVPDFVPDADKEIDIDEMAPSIDPRRPFGDQSNFLKVRRSHVLMATWAGYAGYTMARRPFSVARSDIQHETNLSTFESSSVDTAFLLMYTIAQLMYGSYIKGKLSPKAILILGLVGSALCCGVVAISSSGFMFVLAWGLNGLFQAAGWASCMSILTPWLSSHERGVVMGVWGTNMAAGGVLGNVIPSFIMSLGYSWRSALGIDVIMLLAIAAFTSLTLIQHPNQAGFLSSKQQSENITWDDLQDSCGEFTIDGELIPQSEKSTDAIKGSGTKAAEQTLTFVQTLAIPGIFAISASYFFHKLVRYALMFWLPFYFNKELHYTTVDAGYVSSAVDVGGLFGSIAAGVFSDLYGGGQRRAMSTLYFVMGMAISTSLFVMCKEELASSVVVSCLVSAAVGFFAFAIDSLMSGSYLQDYCERINVIGHMGAISGVVGGIGAAGSIVQGYLTVILSSASWDSLFFTLALMTVFAGALMWTPIMAERKIKLTRTH